ncbi:hypothetical protein [Salinigranum salinum]|uniref:hypothetical protein n=1 Tax=Salinigranum salinum TaxID=1364937 RepID=UPI0012610408|nr:hypothetical protein [Salinigranum salinum]
MSYAESTGELILCSPNRHSLTALTTRIRSKLDEKGAQYNGPKTPPAISYREVHRFLRHLTEPDSEETPEKRDLDEILFRIADSEEHVRDLVSIVEDESDLFVRELLIVGDDSIRSAFSFDNPDDVFVLATLGQRRHQKGRGFDPYSWDPNLDHIPSHPDGW